MNTVVGCRPRCSPFFPPIFFFMGAAAQAGAFLSKGSDRGLDRGLAADESRRQVCLQPRAPPLGATSTPFPLSFDHLLVCRQSRRPVYRQCARTPSFRGTEGVAHSCVPLAGSSTLQVGVGSSERARVWHQRVWQPDSCGEHPLLPPHRAFVVVHSIEINTHASPRIRRPLITCLCHAFVGFGPCVHRRAHFV
jgi:hypothetical protein